MTAPLPAVNFRRLLKFEKQKLHAHFKELLKVPIESGFQMGARIPLKTTSAPAHSNHKEPTRPLPRPRLIYHHHSQLTAYPPEGARIPQPRPVPVPTSLAAAFVQPMIEAARCLLEGAKGGAAKSAGEEAMGNR